MTDTPQTQYRQEFVLGFAQRQSLLKDTTTKEMVIKGNQAVFLVANTTNRAVRRGVNGLIPSHENDNAQVTATLEEAHDLGRLSGFNIFKSQADQRAIMQMNTMSAINLDMDEVILNELANGTQTTGAAAVASATMIGKALTKLVNNKVPMDGQIFAIITNAFWEYLSQLPNFASADYVDKKPNIAGHGTDVNNVGKAASGYWEWKGVKWIVHSGLAGVGTASETCFMFHRSAIGHAINTAGIDSEIGYNGEQQYSWSRCSLFHGAKLLNNAGVVKMIHDGSAFA